MDFEFDFDTPRTASGNPVHPKVLELRASLAANPPVPKQSMRPPKKSRPVMLDERGNPVAAPTSPKKGDYNERARNYMEGKGYAYFRADHYNTFAGVHNDFLGIFDAVALAPGEIVGVQVTSLSSVSARKKKILESRAYTRWTEAGGKTLVLAFETGKRGAKEVWL